MYLEECFAPTDGRLDGGGSGQHGVDREEGDGGRRVPSGEQQGAGEAHGRGGGDRRLIKKTLSRRQ